MKRNARQRTAVAKLVDYCDRLISRGALEPAVEQQMRELTNEACAAFGMPHIYERNRSSLEGMTL